MVESTFPSVQNSHIAFMINSMSNHVELIMMFVMLYSECIYPHWASLKNMPGDGGNRTYDLWNTSPYIHSE
jgi:hypothetical protein